MTNKTTKHTYIQAIEAANIYEATYRGVKIKSDRDASIPYSLELKKLREIGMDEYKINKWDVEKGGYDYTSISDLEAREIKKVSKFNTDDIINVKFNRVVKNKENTIKAINKSINDFKEKAEIKGYELEDIKQFIDSRLKEIETIKESDNKYWGYSLDEKALRVSIYESGFSLPNYKGEIINYVPYKRSSAKARVGKILFINEKLYAEMNLWSRMGFDIDLNTKLDTASLMAYESLVSSSIKSTININPKNILIVSDVQSTFKTALKEVSEVEGELNSTFNPNGTITNELFDGQGLLDSSYFDGKGMMLLRQHFFKSCVFNVNVIQFMKDTFGKDYDTATIKDLFGNKIKVKDIHMITTPSSLKTFKFSFLMLNDKKELELYHADTKKKFPELKGPQEKLKLKADKAMFKHWKKVVKEDGNLFGVCKSESVSKRGDKLQQMSYQMLNSLPTDKKGIEELSSNEIKYTNAIKNDNEMFIEHLKATASRMNANEMFVELYNRNKDIQRTALFNEFKKYCIKEYIKNMKTGKIRITGDYCVMVGNPYEMLLHSIGKLNTDNVQAATIKGSQVYTTLFEPNTKLVGFRNPHTSANNIYSCENVSNELLQRYMNFTPNIVAVNVINNPINDILSGADFDSDTVLLTDNKKLVEIAESNKAVVCVNKITSTKRSYTLQPKERAIVDSSINSDLIGKVVNTGQVCQSIMYDALERGDKEAALEAENLLEIINVFSTIAIDLAKKKFEIEVDSEFDRLSKLVKKLMKSDNDGNTYYPNFFTKKESNKKVKYNTPMDYLLEVLKDGIERQAGLYDKVEEFELIMPCDEQGERFVIKEANDKQEREILEATQKHSNAIARLNSMIEGSSEDSKKSIIAEMSYINESFSNYMRKKTIKPVTMYTILYHLFETKSIEVSPVRLLNALYDSSPKTFINIFIEKRQEK